ncbi:MAG TPA: NAD kinase [Candidatus Nanopelagicales bacterium]|nr:NAD kinase [Candidatus Nanopelagicales bacterium]
MTTRRVLLAVHGARPEAVAVSSSIAGELAAAGIEVRVQSDVDVVLPGATSVPFDSAAQGCELVVVVGGDGTMLRGAELARPYDVPILGVNLGRVGFLAEAERDEVRTVVDAVVSRTWTLEERTTLEVVVNLDGAEVARTWALNEASVEKASRERMLEVLVEVDGRPLSRWGTDGVVAATPTGSTAYAFSAGGPVVWPEVQALLVVPISAHALFARPLVVAPTSRIAVEVLPQESGGVMWCDGRRLVELPPGSRVEISRHPSPVRFARLHQAPFTDRLVAKFALPVDGWRGQREEHDHHDDHHEHGVAHVHPTHGAP